MRTGYLPKEERKTILLLSDDMRTPSGVGVMSREIIEGTCHRYNWVQVGASVNAPDEGKILEMSGALTEITGVEDPYVRIYPVKGYGNSRLVRFLMDREKPDAIFHFTDPRYWLWLYDIEHEIRQDIPMFYYSIWDDLPYPYYNETYYRSDDWIAAISKQTYNIVKNVCRKEPREDWSLSYVPHGINPEKFFPITEDNEDATKQLTEFRSSLFNGEEVDFSMLFVSRNIHRKHPSDIILAFKHFTEKLTPEQADRCRLILHTAPIDPNGTDLLAVLRDVAPNIKVVFSQQRVPVEQINLLHNVADVTINISSNEGFGLSTCESMMAGNPIIVNVTGGLQDQCGFRDEKGDLVQCETHFTHDWGSNHDGRYKDHGEWAFPIWPASISLQGSPLTPYIFDDRADWKEAADKMLELYNMTPEERKRRGMAGREYALGEGRFSAEHMCESFITNMEVAWDKWTPRKKFTLLEA